jgi:hypothetical protein
MSDSGMSIDDDDEEFDFEEDDSQLQFEFALDDEDQTAETLMEEVEQFLRDQDGR